MKSIYGKIEIETGNQMPDSLVTTIGMGEMINTADAMRDGIWWCYGSKRYGTILRA